MVGDAFKYWSEEQKESIGCVLISMESKYESINVMLLPCPTTQTLALEEVLLQIKTSSCSCPYTRFPSFKSQQGYPKKEEEKMTEKRSTCGYENHGKHQLGWYIVTDQPNYITCNEETMPACQDIRDAVNHNHHHRNTYGTYGEKHVQKTDEKTWFMKEHVHYSRESINTEADEFIQLKHKNFEMSKQMSLWEI